MGLSALATLAFWTAIGFVCGGVGGALIGLCLMLLVPPKPSTDNMIGGLFVGACGLFGLVLGLIGGATRATHVVRGKYGPRWRERIRNPNQEWVVSPETNPPSAPGGSVGRS